MKKLLLVGALILVGIGARANLLENGSFEEYTCSSFMGLHSADFTGWSFGSAWAKDVDSVDVIDGKVAFVTTTEVSQNMTLYQSVDCSEYQTGDKFRIVIYFKDVEEGDDLLTLDCYWASSAGIEKPEVTDPSLYQVLPKTTDWDSIEVFTTKPERVKNFEYRITVKKKARIALDNLKFEYVEPELPYLNVLPDKTSYLFTTNINTDTVVAKLTVRQKNLVKPVLLELSGLDRAAYSINKNQLTEEEEIVEVRFKASKVGKYNAMLNMTYDDYSLINTSISFTGTVIDNTKKPSITITPLEFDTFRCKAYESVTDTFIVRSENCSEDIHVVVNDETGSHWAFGISDSYFLKNETDTVVITFSPRNDGLYTAQLKAYTTGVDTIFFSVIGEAGKGQPSPVEIDYDTVFVWDAAQPMVILNERFDMGGESRNKTLKVEGWQNVVLQGNRAWWGFNSDSTEQAKMTSYAYQTDSGSIAFETWLVTPALDYHRAEEQLFTFHVMSDVIYEGQTAKLELYYIDPTNKDDIFFQHIAAVDTLIPSNDSELEGIWIPIYIDLSNQPTIAEIFYMAFKFTDMGGSNGCTYYIDNVTWGIQPQTGVETTSTSLIPSAQKILQNGHIYIRRSDGVIYNILGSK